MTLTPTMKLRGMKIKRVHIGKKVRVRTGAIIGQDMGVHKWTDNGEIFTVMGKVNETRYKLIADGYGDLKGNYGNGAIYVTKESLKGIS